VKCIETSPPVYLVKDDHGEILEGTFYAEELQKVIKTNDVYKIETILWLAHVTSAGGMPMVL
jgi:hypothetical protein